MILRLRSLSFLSICMSVAFISYMLFLETSTPAQNFTECAPFAIPSNSAFELDDVGKLRVPEGTTTLVLQIGTLTRFAEPLDNSVFVVVVESDPFRRALARSLVKKDWKGAILPFAVDKCDRLINRNEGWKVGVDETSLPVQAVTMSTIFSLLPENVTVGLVVLDSRSLQMYIAAKALSNALAVKVVGKLGRSD